MAGPLARYCKNLSCGYINSSTARFCGMCGVTLPDPDVDERELAAVLADEYSVPEIPAEDRVDLVAERGEIVDAIATGYDQMDNVDYLVHNAERAAWKTQDLWDKCSAAERVPYPEEIAVMMIHHQRQGNDEVGKDAKEAIMGVLNELKARYGNNKT